MKSKVPNSVTFHRKVAKRFILVTFLLISSGCVKQVSFPGIGVEPFFGEPPKTLKAVARVKLLSKNIKGRARVELKTPDKVRIEVLDPLGRVIFVIAGEAEKCTLYNDGILKTCKWDDPALGFFINSRELYSLLTGRVVGEWKKIEGKKDGFVRLKREGGIFSPVLSLGNFREIEGLVIPFTIEIKNNGDTLTLEYLKAVINPTLKNDRFSLGQ
ncbi:MAG: hypothetical protein KAT46_00945 [Deltaproteobacteria bacterium]|nr:hypothetical protein [Deltaproteobacteria bacterium]